MWPTSPTSAALLFVSPMTQGLQWVLLAEEEIAPAIVAMDGRRSRCAKAEHQGGAAGDGHTQDVSNAKLLRKLEAQGASAKGVVTSNRKSNDINERCFRKALTATLELSKAQAEIITS